MTLFIKEKHSISPLYVCNFNPGLEPFHCKVLQYIIFNTLVINYKLKIANKIKCFIVSFFMLFLKNSLCNTFCKAVKF